jgi:hypothetical protein
MVIGRADSFGSELGTLLGILVFATIRLLGRLRFLAKNAPQHFHHGPRPVSIPRLLPFYGPFPVFLARAMLCTDFTVPLLDTIE